MNTIYMSPQSPLRYCTVSWFTSSSRLLRFLIVSLSLHGLLFAMMPRLEPFMAPGQKVMQPPVFLTLNTVPSSNRVQSKPVTVHHPTSITQPSRHELLKPSHHVKNVRARLLKVQTKTHSPSPSKAKNTSHHETPAHDIRTTQLAIATPSPYPRQSTPKPSPNPAAVAALLRRALQQHFHYPVVALQNNWEGKVILGVRVTAGGEVSAAQVLKASGFRVLDRAAQHAVNDIGRLSTAPPLLAGQTLTFRVPVAYRIRR